MWYRIYLTVRDSRGLTNTTLRDILPRKVVLTLATNPAGLQLKLDGQPVATPLSFDAVVGIVRTIEAVTPQSSGGTTYTFVSWSDGGAASHTSRRLQRRRPTPRRTGKRGGSGSIALDAVSSSPNETNVGSVSWSHTSAGSNERVGGGRGVARRDRCRPTRGGRDLQRLALTRIRQDDEPVNNVYASVWYLVNPPAGAHMVAITYTSAVTEPSVPPHHLQGWTSVADCRQRRLHAVEWHDGQPKLATVAANAWVLDMQYAGADGAVAPPRVRRRESTSRWRSAGRRTTW